MALALDRFTVMVHEAGDGSMWAELVELPGWFVCGDSLDELGDGLARAMASALSDAPGPPVTVRVSNWAPVGGLDFSGTQMASQEWTVELVLDD